jgi:hypothetical protein
MRYQLLRSADHDGQPGREEHTVVHAAEPLAGAAGLQWLWGMVELSVSPGEPDTAA